MISLADESLVPLAEVPKRLPARPNGKRVHISACYRWVATGVRGVRLESIRVGGTTYTSLQAIQRFADAVSQRVRPGRDENELPKSRSARIGAAASRLEFELALPPGRLSREKP